MNRLPSLLGACLVLVACGGRVESTEPVSNTPGSASNVDAGESLPFTPVPWPETPPDSGATQSETSAVGICAPLSDRVPPVTDESVFRSWLIGTWTLCSSKSVFSTVEGGLEIAADGHWYKLYSDGAGGLKHGSGIDDEGTWSIFDSRAMSGTFELTFELRGSTLFIYTLPQFFETPRGMRLDNMAIWIGDYVKAG